MADRIALTGLQARGYHGVFDFERRRGQDFSCDITMWTDFSAAAASDELADTIDYGAIAQLAHQVLTGPPMALIESVSTTIAEQILLADDARAQQGLKPLLHAVEVTVHKPQAPIPLAFGDAAVTARRSRKTWSGILSRPQRAPRRFRAVLSIGGNQGDVWAALDSVFDHFKDDIVARSQVYGTPAWGGVAQDDFLNAVLIIETDLKPLEILRAGQALEQQAQRVRDQRWGPRTLDVDVVQVVEKGDSAEIESPDPELTLPHPYAHQRAFVLVPWLEADPQAQLKGTPVAELVASLDATERDSIQPVTPE